MKWNRDRNGGCDYIMVGNTKYYIIDALLRDGSISNYWHIEKRQIIDQNKKQYKSLVDMLKELFDVDAKTESEALWSIRFKAEYSGGGSELLRKYEKDGRHYAIDLRTKTHWEYTLPEKVSPDFRTVEEVKAWADQHLDIQQGLF